MIRLIGVVGACFFLTVPSTHAREPRSGEWFSDSTKSASYAAVMNDSGNLFGQFCYIEEAACIYLIGIPTRCDKDEAYPVLANSDSGARPLEIICRGKLESGLYTYAFANFDAVDDIVKSGSRIGIAFPLQSDNFRVIRFELQGASSVIAAMRATAERKIKPSKRGTRDQIY